MDNKIHETAIIGENVKIGKGNIIGAYTVIYDNVEIGDNNTIGSFVVIGGDGETKRETEFTKKIILGEIVDLKLLENNQNEEV